MKVVALTILAMLGLIAHTKAVGCDNPDFNTDYYGQDFGEAPFTAATWADCQYACGDWDLCQTWTWHYSSKLCFRKRGEPRDIRSDPDAVSGLGCKKQK